VPSALDSPTARTQRRRRSSSRACSPTIAAAPKPSRFLEYTRLAPNGSFAEESWGRLVELARASGDVALARSRARFYVDRFPNGASIDVARDLLAK